MPRYLTEADVDQLADMPLALRAIEGSFERQGRGAAANIGRRRARIEPGALQLMGAADAELGAAGAKMYTTFRGGRVSFVVTLFDVASGELRAVLEAGRLGELRTGAASGVSAKYLARPAADVIAIIGSGRQTRTQLEAVCSVRPPAAARVYSRNPAHVQSFIEAVRPIIEVELHPAESAEACVRDAHIVITATSAARPVIQGAWLASGAHVIAMGTNDPAHTELDVATVARADRVFVDDLQGAQLECGDLIAAANAGALQWGQVHELAQVAAGRIAGRSAEDEITLFESQGIALWDIALAHAVVAKAEVADVGTEIGG